MAGLSAPHGHVQARGAGEKEETLGLGQGVHAPFDLSAFPPGASSSSSSDVGEGAVWSGATPRLVSDGSLDRSLFQSSQASLAGVISPQRPHSSLLPSSCPGILPSQAPKASHLLVESDPRRLLGWTLNRLFHILRTTSLIRTVALPLLHAVLSLTIKQRLPRGLRRYNRASRRAAFKHAAVVYTAGVCRRRKREERVQDHDEASDVGREERGRGAEEVVREQNVCGIGLEMMGERGAKGAEISSCGSCSTAEPVKKEADRQRGAQQREAVETVALAAAILAVGKTADQLPPPSPSSLHRSGAEAKRSKGLNSLCEPFSEEDGDESQRGKERRLAACCEGGELSAARNPSETRSLTASDGPRLSCQKLQAACPISSKSSTVSGYSTRRTRGPGEEDQDPWLSAPDRPTATWDSFLRVPGPPSEHLVSAAFSELRRLYALYVAMVQFLFLEEKEAELLRGKSEAGKSAEQTKRVLSGAAAGFVQHGMESHEDSKSDGRGGVGRGNSGIRREGMKPRLQETEGTHAWDVLREQDSMVADGEADNCIDFFTFLRLPLLARLRVLTGVDRGFQRPHCVQRGRAEAVARDSVGFSSQGETKEKRDDPYKLSAAGIVERLGGLLQPQKVFDDFFMGRSNSSSDSGKGTDVRGKDRPQETATVSAKVHLTCPFGAARVGLPQARAGRSSPLRIGAHAFVSSSASPSAYLSGSSSCCSFSAFCSALDEFCTASATQQVADFCLEVLPWSSSFASLALTDSLCSSGPSRSTCFCRHPSSVAAHSPGLGCLTGECAAVERARQCLAVVAEVVNQSSPFSSPSSRLLKQRAVVGEIALCAVYHKASFIPAERLLSVVDRIYNALPQSFDEEEGGTAESSREGSNAHQIKKEKKKQREGGPFKPVQNVGVAEQGGRGTFTDLSDRERPQREASSGDEGGLALMAEARYRKRVRALAGGADMLEQHLNVVEFLQRLLPRQGFAFPSSCSVTFAQLEAGCLFPGAARLLLPSILRRFCSTACRHPREGAPFNGTTETETSNETAADALLRSSSSSDSGGREGVACSMFVDHAVYIQRRACAAVSPDTFFGILLHTCATELILSGVPSSSFAMDVRSTSLPCAVDEPGSLFLLEGEKEVLSRAWKRRVIDTRVQEGRRFIRSSGLGILLEEILERWLDVALLSGEAQNGLFLCRVGEVLLSSARELINTAPSLNHSSLDAAQMLLSLFKIMERHRRLRRGGAATSRSVSGGGAVEGSGAQRRGGNGCSSLALRGPGARLLSRQEKDMYVSATRRSAFLSRQVETELLLLSFVKDLHALCIQSRVSGPQQGDTEKTGMLAFPSPDRAGNAVGAFEALASKAGSSAKAVTARAASAVVGAARQGGARALGALGVSSAASTFRLLRGGVARYGRRDEEGRGRQEQEVSGGVTAPLQVSQEDVAKHHGGRDDLIGNGGPPLKPASRARPTLMHKRKQKLSRAASEGGSRGVGCFASSAQPASPGVQCLVSAWPETPLQVRLAAGVRGGLSRLLQGILSASPATADGHGLLEELARLSDLTGSEEDKAEAEEREEQMLHIMRDGEQQGGEKRGENSAGLSRTAERHGGQGAGDNGEGEMCQGRKEQRRRRIIQETLRKNGRWTVLVAQARAYWVRGKRQEALLVLASLLAQQQQARHASYGRPGPLADGQRSPSSSPQSGPPSFSSDLRGRREEMGTSESSTPFPFGVLLEMEPSLSVLTFQLTRSPASFAFSASPMCRSSSQLEPQLEGQPSAPSPVPPFFSPSLRGGLLALTISACRATHLPLLLQAFARAQHEHHATQSAGPCEEQGISALAEREANYTHRATRTSVSESRRARAEEKGRAVDWTKDWDRDRSQHRSEQYWWPERGSDWFTDLGCGDTMCSTSGGDDEAGDTVCRGSEGSKQTEWTQAPIGAASSFWEASGCRRGPLDIEKERVARSLSVGTQDRTEAKPACFSVFASRSGSSVSPCSEAANVTSLFVRARAALGLAEGLSRDLQGGEGRTSEEKGRDRGDKVTGVPRSSPVPVKPLPVAPAALVFSAIEAAEGVVSFAASRAKEEYGRRLGGRSVADGGAMEHTEEGREQLALAECSPCHRSAPSVPALQRDGHETGDISDWGMGTAATRVPRVGKKDEQLAFVGPLADTLRAVAASRDEEGRAGEGTKGEVGEVSALGDGLAHSSHLPAPLPGEGPHGHLRSARKRGGQKVATEERCELPQGEKADRGGEQLADPKTGAALSSFLGVRRERGNGGKKEHGLRRAAAMLAVLNSEVSVTVAMLEKTRQGRELARLLFFWPARAPVVGSNAQSTTTEEAHSGGDVQAFSSASTLPCTWLVKEGYGEQSSWDLPLSLFERAWEWTEEQHGSERLAAAPHAVFTGKDQVRHEACRSEYVDGRVQDRHRPQLDSGEIPFQPLLRILTRVDAEAAFLLAATLPVFLPSSSHGGTLSRYYEPPAASEGGNAEEDRSLFEAMKTPLSEPSARNSALPLSAFLLLRHCLSESRKIPSDAGDIAPSRADLTRSQTTSRLCGDGGDLKSLLTPDWGLAAAGRASVAAGCLAQLVLQWSFVVPSCSPSTPGVPPSSKAAERKDDGGDRAENQTLLSSCSTVLHSLILVRKFFEACAPLQMAILSKDSSAIESRFPVVDKSKSLRTTPQVCPACVVARLARDEAFRKQQLLRLTCSSPHLMNAAGAVLLIGAALQIALPDLHAYPGLLPPSSFLSIPSKDTTGEHQATTWQDRLSSPDATGKERRATGSSLEKEKGVLWRMGEHGVRKERAEDGREQRYPAELVEGTEHTSLAPASEASQPYTCLPSKELGISEEVLSMRLDAFEKLFLSPNQPLYSFLDELQVQLPSLLRCAIFSAEAVQAAAERETRGSKTHQLKRREEGAGATAELSGNLRQYDGVWETGRRVLRLLRVFTKAMVQAKEGSCRAGALVTLLDHARLGVMSGGVKDRRAIDTLEHDEELQVEELGLKLKQEIHCPSQTEDDEPAPSCGRRRAATFGAPVLREMAEKTLILRRLFACVVRAADCSPAVFLARVLRLRSADGTAVKAGEADTAGEEEAFGGRKKGKEVAGGRTSSTGRQELEGSWNGDGEAEGREQYERTDVVGGKDSVPEISGWIATQTGLGVPEVDETLQSLAGCLPLLDITALFLPPGAAASASVLDVVPSTSPYSYEGLPKSAEGCEASGTIAAEVVADTEQGVASLPLRGGEESSGRVAYAAGPGGREDAAADPFFCAVLECLLGDRHEQPSMDTNALPVLFALQQGSELVRRRCPPGLLAEQVLVAWLVRQKGTPVCADDTYGLSLVGDRTGEENCPAASAEKEANEASGQGTVDLGGSCFVVLENESLFISLLLELVPLTRWTKVLGALSAARRIDGQEDSTNCSLSWQLVLVGCMRRVLSEIVGPSARERGAEEFSCFEAHEGMRSPACQRRCTTTENVAPDHAHEDNSREDRSLQARRAGQGQQERPFYSDLQSFLLKVEARLVLAVACEQSEGRRCLFVSPFPLAGEVPHFGLATGGLDRAIALGRQTFSASALLSGLSLSGGSWYGKEEALLSLECTKFLAYCDESKFGASRTIFWVSLCTSVLLLVSDRTAPSSGEVSDQLRWATEKEELLLTLRSHVAATRRTSFLSYPGGSNPAKGRAGLVTEAEVEELDGLRRRKSPLEVADESQVTTAFFPEASPDEAAASKAIGECVGAFLALGIRQWLDGLLRRLLAGEEALPAGAKVEYAGGVGEELEGERGHLLGGKELLLLAHLGHHLQLLLGRVREVLAADAHAVWEVRRYLFETIVGEVSQWVVECCSTTGEDRDPSAVPSLHEERDLRHFFCLVVCDTLLQHRPLIQHHQKTHGRLSSGCPGLDVTTPVVGRTSFQLDVAVLWLTAQCMARLLVRTADGSFSGENNAERKTPQVIFADSVGREQHLNILPSFSDAKAPDSPSFSFSESLHSFLSFCSLRFFFSEKTSDCSLSRHPLPGTQRDVAEGLSSRADGRDVSFSEWRFGVCFLLVTDYLRRPSSDASNAQDEASKAGGSNASSSTVTSKEKKDETANSWQGKQEEAVAGRLLLAVLLVTAKHLYQQEQLESVSESSAQSSAADLGIPRCFLAALSHNAEEAGEQGRGMEGREGGDRRAAKQNGRPREPNGESVAAEADPHLLLLKKSTSRRLRLLTENYASEEEALLLAVLVGRLDTDQVSRCGERRPRCSVDPHWRVLGGLDYTLGNVSEKGERRPSDCCCVSGLHPRYKCTCLPFFALTLRGSS